jgi:hypothetical protein
MTTERNDATHMRIGREPPASPAEPAGAAKGAGAAEPGSPASGGRGFSGPRRRLYGVTVVAAAAIAVVGVLVWVGARGQAHAASLNCSATPHLCSYVDATNTGVPSGTTLTTVSAKVASGPGWKYIPANGEVLVSTNGTVLSGLYIPYELVIDASNVTVNNVQVVAGGNFGVALENTTNVTIENSTISGVNATALRVGSAIDDVYGDSTGTVIKNDNISLFKTGIQISTGLIEGSYIHNPGYIAGDHTNGIYVNGGTAPLTIENNTIFNSSSETDAINLDAGAAGSPVANKTVENNFLAGGTYTIYGGDGPNNPTSNIVIENNRFGQLYYPTSGQFGPAAYYATTGTGNVWSGNFWDTTGQAIAAP